MAVTTQLVLVLADKGQEVFGGCRYCLRWKSDSRSIVSVPADCKSTA